MPSECDPPSLLDRHPWVRQVLSRRTGAAASVLLALFLVRSLMADEAPAPDHAAGPETTGAVPAPATATADDKDAWTTSPCLGCHGREAEGVKGRPPLAGTKLTAEQFGKIVREGRGKMPGYDTDTLSDDQLGHLYNYLHSLPAPAAPSATANASPTQPSVRVTPQQAWKAASCGGCHGAAAGGGMAPALAGTRLSAAEFTHITRTGRKKMPSYDTDELPQERLDLVYKYVRSLPLAAPSPITPHQGAAPPVIAKVSAQAAWTACAGCHGATGEGGTAPALAGTRLMAGAFSSIVRHGRRKMPAYSAAELPPATLSAIYRLMRSRKATSAPPIVQVPPPSKGAAPQPGIVTVSAQAAWSACAGCHGAAGEGGMGPRLAGTALTAGAFFSIVRDGRGKMPAYSAAELPPATLSVVYSLMRNSQAASAPPVGQAPPVSQLPTPGQTPTAGHMTVPSQAPPPAWNSCGGCHGATGMGGSAPRLTGTRLGSQQFTAIVRQGKGKMPPFAAATLPDKDVQAIYTFLRKAPAGAVVAVAPRAPGGVTPPTGVHTVAPDLWNSTSCAGCHGPTAMGGMGPALADTRLSYESFASIVRKGKGKMPPTPESELSSSELHKIYELLGKTKVDVSALSPSDRLQAWLTRRHVGLGLLAVILLSCLSAALRLAQAMNAAGWRRLKPHLKTLGTGRVVGTFFQAIVVDGLLVGSLWRRSRFLWAMHALLLYGSLALGLAALRTLLRPGGPGMLPFLPPLHSLAGLAAMAVLLGIFFVRYRYSTDPYTEFDQPDYESKYVLGRDYIALTTLSAALLGALLVQLLQDIGQREFVIPAYLIYLLAIGILFLWAPSTGLAHAFIAPFYSALLSLARQVIAKGVGVGEVPATLAVTPTASAREAARMLRAIDPEAQDAISFLLPQLATAPAAATTPQSPPLSQRR